MKSLGAISETRVSTGTVTMDGEYGLNASTYHIAERSPEIAPIQWNSGGWKSV